MQRPKSMRGISNVALLILAGSALGVASTSSAAPSDTYDQPADPIESGEGTVLLYDSENPDREPVSLDLAQIRAMMGAAGGSRASAPKKGSWGDISKGFTKVISTAEGGSLYDVYLNKETNQMLAELPRGYERQKQFFAMTVAGGETFAGLQAGDMYVQWQKINDRLALVMPQLEVRSTGDQESKDSVNMIFTDRVLLSVPIVTNGPKGQPVIDLDGLLVGNASRFFGGSARGLDSSLTKVKSVKAFPENIEVRFEAPTSGGTIKEFHYSISKIQGTPGYRPREADHRVGYFTTSYEDFGKFDWNDVNRRYINRWHIEKADNNLKMSPPKEPLVYYVEHTVPIRYRRWVKEGIDYWNDAFREVGIDGAIEIRYQDKRTGSHMEKDPEDVRYNFIRWLSNDVATAIGPSRVNPETGEILDADVVLTDGWVRVFRYRWSELMPELAMEGMNPQTVAWLDRNPQWDPRVRFADPVERDELMAQRMRDAYDRMHNHDAHEHDNVMLGSDELDGLSGRVSQVSGLCKAAHGKAMSLTVARMYLDMIDVLAIRELAEQAEATTASEPEGDGPEIDPAMLEVIKKQLEENPALLEMIPPEYRAMLEKELAKAEEPEGEPEPDADEEGDKPKKKAKKDDDEQLIDGLPEAFVGPMLAELVAHEVGHTIGLRHNFKGSSYLTVDEINSAETKGKQPWSMSVMDYNGLNIRMPGFGEEQGDYSVIDIGPYDYWAIEYGYGFGKPEEVAKRAADPRLQYATDEDTWGPDPLARRYDMGKDPINFARNQVALAKEIRKNIVDHFVEDGETWAQARRGYQITLSQQMSAISTMANWVGSAYVYRDKKGDPDGRAPIEVVPAETQREALQFCVETAFRDDSYGLSPELLKYLTVDKWWDTGGMSTISQDATFPVHDRILGMQASTLSMLLNPTTLQRVYDLEAFVPADQDALTVAEVLDTINTEIWTELDETPSKRFTAREPMISSIRRNLQREHIDRLIDLSMAQGAYSASEMPVKTLATMYLRDLHARMEGFVDGNNAKRLDPYTRAHLTESSLRISKALDAGYVYNQAGGGAMGPISIILGQEGETSDRE